MKNSKLDLRKKLNTVKDSEGNVFTAEKVTNGYIVNCESQNKESHFCFANDVKDLFMLFMYNDNQKAIAKLLNKLQAEPVQAEPVAAEQKKDITMLTIKQALQIKPVFILAVNYDAGSIGEMVGENRDLNLYLADMTIQYSLKDNHNLVDNACLSFTTECLVSVNDNIVTIDEMNTSSDNQSVYAQNIAELTSISGNSVNIYQDGLCDAMQDFLIDLMESQPIYKIPKDFIIEAY